MTDHQNTPMATTKQNGANSIYILYLASIVFGITAVIGVVMAYVYRGDADDWLRSHYTFQIHTFWKGLLFALVGVILIPVMLGFLVLAALLFWWIIRNVKGIKALGAEQPITDTRTWMW